MTKAAPLVKIFETGDYEQQVCRAASHLKQGGVVVLPTETVYGAAAMLGHPTGLYRLRNLEPATTSKPLIIHLANPEEAGDYTASLSDLGRRMVSKLWPGPVALVFDVSTQRQHEVAGRLGVSVEEIYDGSSITLRCPDHMVARDVIAAAGGPVVLRKAPMTESDLSRGSAVADAWADRIDLIVDAGAPRYQKPSTIVHVKEDSYEIERSGVYDQRIIERLLRTTLLFVCSGNTCRSPMAEALARKVLAGKLGVPESDLDKKGFTVTSAGSFAMPGARATPAAIEALKPMGVDLSRHRSRPLSVELIHQADVIFVMGQSHAMAVRSLVPSAGSKVVSLDPDKDIDDPIGSDVSVYRGLAGVLEDLIAKRLSEQAIGR